MVSNQVINSDSNYKFMKAVIEGLLGIGDEKTVIIIFLPYSKNIKYINDGLQERYGDKVKIVLLKSPSRKVLQAKFFNSEYIYQIAKRYGINIFFNNVVEVSILFKNLLSTAIAELEPLTISYNHYTIHPTLPYTMDGYLPLRILEIIGNIYSDIAIFNTNYNKSMLIDNMRELGYESFIERLEGHSYIIPIPVLDSELKKYYRKERIFSNDEVIFYYNHRLQAYKNWKKTFNILKEFWDKYKNFKVYVSYASGDNVKKIVEEYPFVVVKNTFTHSEYYKELDRPHFNILDSLHETFCISIVESALLGGIPIVNNKTTMPEIFYKDYEFMFRNDKELRDILENILTGRYSNEYLSGIKNKLLKHFSQYESGIIGKRIYELLSNKHIEIAKKDYKRLKTRTILDRLIERHRGRPIIFKELWLEAKRVLGLGEQALTPWRFSRLLDNYRHRKYFHNGELYIEIL